MNPLSPLTYYRRHKRSALLLIALITLATMGLFVLIGVLDSLALRAQTSYLTQLSRISPLAGRELEPGLVSQLQTHPGVERLMPENGLSIWYPVLMGSDSMPLMGVSPTDAETLMDNASLRLKSGRLFAPRTNEFMLTEEAARALGLELGDEVDRSTQENFYHSIVTPLVLVGILEGNPATALEGAVPRLGFVSGEYLASHELYAPRRSRMVVIAKDGHKETVDSFLESTIASERTRVETFRELTELMDMARQGLFLIFGIVNWLLAIIIAAVVAVINRIALSQRLSELGLLNALGHDKGRLIGRITLETTVVAGIGWAVGLALAWLFMVFLKENVYYALGQELDLGNPAPFLFVLPIPLAVVVFVGLSVRRVFRRFDAVSIVERGKLGAEEKSRAAVKRSTAKPLSALTFYLRHRRRAILLVGAMALMILGVSFPAFLMLTSINAMKPEIDYLQHLSEIYPAQGREIDPGVAAQIRNHPAVERTFSAIPLYINVTVPPGGGVTLTIYGLSEDDMPAMMDLFGIEIKEGHLPRPRSNEIAISEMIAQNRGLHVGDLIGGPDQAIYEDGIRFEDDVPAEMVISGILSPDQPWLGLASHEYLSSHELTTSRPNRLLVVPVAGRKAALDEWLRADIASVRTDVETYQENNQQYQELTLSITVMFALVESLLAIVAAIALAALNYIFFSQRREEFGILHAVGRSRPWLVWRTVRETGSVAAIAWLLGAAVCIAGLALAQALIYSPRGLSADLSTVLPWLFTLPIPLAVVAVSSGTISRMLRKLDPVATIERRS